jgi:glycerol-3-phosphate dehydrogenase
MHRDSALRRLQNESNVWDVLIIGGGATGLGAAVDSAARGYSTLLLEGHDFAKGTSSRSTKLIHGGVRYLRQGNISLVTEALHERGLLIRNAPHLVHDQPFLIPAYRWGEATYFLAGLKAYDWLAGRRNLAPSHSLSRDEALLRVPTLQPNGLRGGVLYHDGQFDDARLAIALARTFTDQGGTAVNYMPVVRLLKENDKLCGVVARDLETGHEYEIRAKAIVNATGVFSDAIRRLDEPDAESLVIASQGIHLVLDGEFLPGCCAVMVPSTDDGRVLFAIPWHGKVLLGTTDTPVPDASFEPRALDEEIEYLLRHAARYFSFTPQLSDVRSVFAGLRPLVRPAEAKKTASISREHHIGVSRSGLITIAGGKWTTYRRMGQDTIDTAAQTAGLPARPCATESLHLHGWTENTGRFDAQSVYGSDEAAISEMAKATPNLSGKLHPRLPYLQSEVVWAARFEMARTVEDILSRRTRALFLDAQAALETADIVAKLLAAELGRDENWKQSQIQSFTDLAAVYLLNQ